MASSINPFTIDKTFPIAGQDNDTQGFRDNFAGAQDNFITTKAEIEALQTNNVVTGPAATNDFLGGLINNAELRDNSLSVTNKGVVSGTVTFDHEDGHVQSFTTGGNVVFAFANFPVTGKYGSILVETNVASDWSISFPPGTILPPDFVVAVDGNATYWYEFVSRDNGATIHLFDRTRSYGANTADINITGAVISTFSTNTDIVLLPNGTGDVQLGTQIIIDGNTITTLLTNANLELDASGTGTIELLTATNITGNTGITGALTITSTISATESTFTGLMHRSVTDAITAGTTQTQVGATALTVDLNRVTISGTNGDGVKLPTAIAGLEVLIINDDSAQTIQIWPNTGDAIDGGSVDAVDPDALIAGDARRYIATDPGNWYTAVVGSAGGLNNIVEDITPQLGGPLDTFAQAINESEGGNVASAGTTNIWVTTGNTLHVTGVTTITSFGTAPRIGAWRKIIFDAALLLTDGANLALPGGADITTAANDFAFVYADTTAQFDVLYFKKDGTAVVGGGLGSIVEDTTPELGGALSTNSFAIDESEAGNVASGATTNIWASTGNTIHVTGTTTITSFGTAPRVGAWRKVIFDDALLLTDGTNINLPGAADITTATDDFAYVYAETTALFKILYFKVDGTAVVRFTDIVQDTTPQLGGALDTNAQAINESEGSVASGTTTDIWLTTANTVHVTGTTAITSFATAPRVGAWRKVIFDSALLLTDGGNLNLPGAADITTATDDFAYVYAETTTLFKVLYFKVDGTAVVRFTDIVQDVTPQLGASLDTNAFAIDGSEGSVASGATTDIWVTTGNTVHVTGTTTITSFSTASRVGAWRKVIFDDVLTLTDGANLNLPGGMNILTVADDFAFVYAETTTLFKVLYFSVAGPSARINAQTGTTYTLTATDNGKVVTLDNAASITLTVPENATETIPVDFQCAIIQKGAGTVTVALEGSDTILSKASNKVLAAQGVAATIIKTTSGAPNAWFLGGDLVA